jgi:hypothetical protein
MLDGVCGHIDDADIVAEHNRSWRRWPMKLMGEMADEAHGGDDLPLALEYK